MAKKSLPRRKAASVKPATRPVRDQINDQRGQLFQAQAVIRCVRFAAASRLGGLDETDITCALAAADRIIDNATAALELVGGAS